MNYKIYEDLNYTMYDFVFSPMLFWFKPFNSYMEYLDILWSPYYFGLEAVELIQSAFHHMIKGQWDEMAANLLSVLFYMVATIFNLMTFFIVIITRKFMLLDAATLLMECTTAIEDYKGQIEEIMTHKFFEQWDRNLDKKIELCCKNLREIRNENDALQIYANIYGLIRATQQFYLEARQLTSMHLEENNYHELYIYNKLFGRYVALNVAFDKANLLIEKIKEDQFSDSSSIEYHRHGEHQLNTLVLRR